MSRYYITYFYHMTIIFIMIIKTSYAPVSSKIKVSGATKSRD